MREILPHGWRSFIDGHWKLGLCGDLLHLDRDVFLFLTSSGCSKIWKDILIQKSYTDIFLKSFKNDHGLFILKLSVFVVCGVLQITHPPVIIWSFTLRSQGCGSHKSCHSYHSYPPVNIQKAIENGHRKFVDFPMKNGGCFHSYVKLPEGTIVSFGAV